MLCLCLVMTAIADCQDPNLSNIRDVSNFELEYDSAKNYYSLVRFKYNDRIGGRSQRRYYGPDSLAGFAEYITLVPFRNGRRLKKGIGYDLLTSGTFFEVAVHDWSGLTHGNQMKFHPNGSLKINEVWDRGILIKSWAYNEDGELIEYKDYD